MAVKIQRGNTKPQKTIVQDITLVSPDRNRKDVGTLKAAIERSESIHAANRSKLYDLYHDITTIDGHLAGIMQKRIDDVKNKEIRFVDAKGQEVEAMEDLIESDKFNRLVELLMERKFWGCFGVEFIVGKTFDFNEIDRKHIRIEKRQIVKSQYDFEGVNIDDLPFVWVTGDKYELGRLLQCSMYALYKRSGFGDFAQYVEIFGQPVRIIYYDAYDTKTKAELRQVLNESGSSLAMMIPKQAQFEMLDGKTSNGNGDLQAKLIAICNEEMSVAILGNTETTTSSKSSGYAQAKEHGQQQLEITKSDLKYMRNALNSEFFLNILKSYGYPVDGGKFCFEKELDMEALKLRLEIDKEVSLKVPVADDYWYETYGIPKPDNYDELKKAQVQTQGIASPGSKSSNASQGSTATNKNDVKITKKEKNLLDRLSDFFFWSE